jgi:hypothetical protein
LQIFFLVLGTNQNKHGSSSTIDPQEKAGMKTNNRDVELAKFLEFFHREFEQLDAFRTFDERNFIGRSIVLLVSFAHKTVQVYGQI